MTLPLTMYLILPRFYENATQIPETAAGRAVKTEKNMPHMPINIFATCSETKIEKKS